MLSDTKLVFVCASVTFSAKLYTQILPGSLWLAFISNFLQF